MMPEVLEVVSDVVTGVDAALDNGAGDDGAGGIAGGVVVADAATLLCGGTNI